MDMKRRHLDLIKMPGDLAWNKIAKTLSNFCEDTIEGLRKRVNNMAPMPDGNLMLSVKTKL